MSYQEFSESVFPLIFIGLSVLPSLNNSVCFSTPCSNQIYKTFIQVYAQFFQNLKNRMADLAELVSGELSASKILCPLLNIEGDII